CRSISNVAIAADRADRSTSWTRRADQRPLPVGPTTSSDGEEAPWRIIAADSRAAPRRPTGRDLRDAREPWAGDGPRTELRSAAKESWVVRPAKASCHRASGTLR